MFASAPYKRRLVWLLAAFVLLCTVFAVVALSVGESRRVIIRIYADYKARLQGWRHKKWWERHWANDPRLGKKLTIPFRLRKLLENYGASFYTLIFVDDSVSSMSQVRRYISQLASDQVVVIISNGPLSQSIIPQNDKTRQYNILFYHDERGYLARQWNVFFKPRLYIVARNGTLMQIQESPPIEEVGGECGCDSKK